MCKKCTKCKTGLGDRLDRTGWTGWWTGWTGWGQPVTREGLFAALLWCFGYKALHHPSFVHPSLLGFWELLSLETQHPTFPTSKYQNFGIKLESLWWLNTNNITFKESKHPLIHQIFLPNLLFQIKPIFSRTPNMSSSSNRYSDAKYPHYFLKKTYKAPHYEDQPDSLLLEPNNHLSYIHSMNEVI